MRLCECGCGKEIQPGKWHKYNGIPRFIHGHNMNGKHHGKDNPMFNQTTSQKQKDAARKTCINRWNDPLQRAKTIKKMSDAQKGNKGSNYIDGRSNLRVIVRQCFKYRQWISDIFTRDVFTCQCCGKHGGTFNAHHVKSFSQIFEENNIKTYEEALNCSELWNINNGITLCCKCHKKEHYNRRLNEK